MQLRGPYAGVSAELKYLDGRRRIGTNGRRGGRLHRTDSVQPIANERGRNEAS